MIDHDGDDEAGLSMSTRSTKRAKGPKPGAKDEGTTGGGDRPTLGQSIDEALLELAQARRRSRASDEELLESVGERGRALVAAGVPLWTVSLHKRIGHVGGFVVFVVLAALGWGLAGLVGWSLLEVFGIRLVSSVPSVVIDDVGLPTQLVTSSTDRFLFSWVMPVLFFVIVLALAAFALLRAAGRWGLRTMRRLALGLFSGYDTGLRADWARLRSTRAEARSARKEARARRSASVAKSRRAVDAATDEQK